MVCITKGAKASLDKVLAENAEVEEGILSPSSMLPPIAADSSLDLQKPLIIRVDSDPLIEDHEK